MTRVLLIRHGETAWNRERRWQGDVDLPLTREGEVQADGLGKKLKTTESLQALYTSDLKRAKETADRIATHIDLPPIIEPAWREMNVGRWAGYTWPEITNRFHDELDRIGRGEDVARGGGETWTAFTERTTGALPAIAKQHPTGTVGIVTHSGVIRAVGLFVLGLPFHRLREITVPGNTGFVTLQAHSGGWQWDEPACEPVAISPGR